MSAPGLNHHGASVSATVQSQHDQSERMSDAKGSAEKNWKERLRTVSYTHLTLPTIPLV